MERWGTDRRGKGAGHYDAQDYRLELEHGITDRFAVSAYANFAGHHIRGLEPEFQRVDLGFAFQGVSAEFKDNGLNTDRDGLGLTFYAEPGSVRILKPKEERVTEYKLETKAIAQKNLLNSRLT